MGTNKKLHQLALISLTMILILSIISAVPLQKISE